MRSRATFLLVLPVVALAIAGCGGGGDDSTATQAVATTPTTTALTKAELIERGDAICAEVNAAVGTVGSSSSETGSPAAQAAGLYSNMVESLKGLGTPQETDGYAEFSTAADELAAAQSEVQLAVERGDEVALSTVESNASSALTSFQAAAQEYGFEDCSQGPSAPSAGAVPGSAGTPEAVEPEAEAVEPEAEPEAEAAPEVEVAPETGGAGGTVEGGGTGGGSEGGGTTGGSSGGIGPG